MLGLSSEALAKEEVSPGVGQLKVFAFDFQQIGGWYLWIRDAISAGIPRACGRELSIGEMRLPLLRTILARLWKFYTNHIIRSKASPRRDSGAYRSCQNLTHPGPAAEILNLWLHLSRSHSTGR